MSLRRKCKTYLAAAVVGVLVGACMEQPEQPVTPSFNQQATTRGGAALGRELRQGDDRKNTRWQRMTDSELADAVAGANGRVMIGLKDADQTDGVDNAGGSSPLRPRWTRASYSFGNLVFPFFASSREHRW